MELKEMIKVMEHFKNGGEVEAKLKYKDEWVKVVKPIWDWSVYNYRIKEQKQKVTIEKWLCRDKKGDYDVIESSNIAKYTPYTKVKLIKIYEVEL